MSDPSCRMYKELLGVYVVGAIEPQERAAVDEHLAQCYECREELAGLAPLPALLRRVPADEAERIAASAPYPAGPTSDPPAGMLESLLARTAASRRTRRVRAMFTAAAALLIAVGGAAAIGESLAPQPTHQPVSAEISKASAGRVTATVRYGDRTWGTSMSVQVTGLPQWTNCKFYVRTKDGRRLLAGAWTVGPDGGNLWYPVAVGVPASRLSGFVLVTAHHRPLRIPAA
ncbi:MAG: anti-sigma factor family protein [Streptosporangiaceae bacterium]